MRPRNAVFQALQPYHVKRQSNIAFHFYLERPSSPFAGVCLGTRSCSAVFSQKDKGANQRARLSCGMEPPRPRPYIWGRAVAYHEKRNEADFRSPQLATDDLVHHHLVPHPPPFPDRCRFWPEFPGHSPTQRPTARDLDRGARARVGRSLARRAMRTDDAEDDEEIETLSTPPSGEQGPAEHAVQTRPVAGGRSLQSLLQSLVPARLQTTQNVPDSPSRHSDMIEEPTQTQGECEAAPDAGAPVLRSAQDDLVNALPVTGREWAYSSRGGGR